MKKSTVILIFVGLFTLSSCGSSWSCKKSYCDIEKEQTKTNAVINNSIV